MVGFLFLFCFVVFSDSRKPTSDEKYWIFLGSEHVSYLLEHGAYVIDVLDFRAGMTLWKNSLKQPFLSPFSDLELMRWDKLKLS